MSQKPLLPDSGFNAMVAGELKKRFLQKAFWGQMNNHVSVVRHFSDLKTHAKAKILFKTAEERLIERAMEIFPFDEKDYVIPFVDVRYNYGFIDPKDFTDCDEFIIVGRVETPGGAYLLIWELNRRD